MGKFMLSLAGLLAFVLAQPIYRQPGPDLRFVLDSVELMPNGMPADDTELYVFSYRTSQYQQVTNNAYDDHDPTWSPDGRQIAFSSLRDYSQNIYIINSDGSGEHNLSNYGGQDSDPSWSPNGTMIAFTRMIDGQPEILVMNSNGSDQRNLTSHPSRDVQPAWAPGGTRIAYSSDRSGTFSIYILDILNQSTTQLTSNITALRPTWTSDGDSIVFRGGYSQNATDIYKVALNDGTVTRVADTLGDISKFRHLPDSDLLAYQNGFGLFLLDVDSGEVREFVARMWPEGTVGSAFDVSSESMELFTSTFTPPATATATSTPTRSG